MCRVRKVLDGIDELIASSLGLVSSGGGKALHQIPSARRLGLNPPILDASILVRRILARIERNWLDARLEGPIRLASRKNWRWEKQLYISKNNTRKETLIEKAIALECDGDWINQVPTLSGVIDASSEQHCNIDLIHKVSPGEFEFIELKYDSDTPLFAAFEILKYGMVYAFSRRNATELGYDPANILLNAKRVTLIVLAPSEYYGCIGHSYRWLESALSNALRGFGEWGFMMDFRFEHFSSRATTPRMQVEGRARLYLPERG